MVRQGSCCQVTKLMVQAGWMAGFCPNKLFGAAYLVSLGVMKKNSLEMEFGAVIRVYCVPSDRNLNKP